MGVSTDRIGKPRRRLLDERPFVLPSFLGDRSSIGHNAVYALLDVWDGTIAKVAQTSMDFPPRCASSKPCSGLGFGFFVLNIDVHSGALIPRNRRLFDSLLD